MTVSRFVEERKSTWDELDSLVSDAGRSVTRLSPDRIRQLGDLYRAAVADLALARRRSPHDPVRDRLEGLVVRSRSLVYEAEPRRRTIWGFLATDYWRAVRERPVPLGVSAALLLGTFVLAAVWAANDPAAASGFVPEAYLAVTEPRDSTDLGLPRDVQAALSSGIAVNNIGVTFLAFAAGVVLGVGTAGVLVFNGALLGAVAGLAIASGNGRPLFELVVAHGVLELSCIIVGAAAGIRLGWALVEPGDRARGEALVAEGRRAVEILLGTAPWLLVAALVEGFITPEGLGLATVTVVGLALGTLYWWLVWWRGSQPGESLRA